MLRRSDFDASARGVGPSLVGAPVVLLLPAGAFARMTVALQPMAVEDELACRPA
jgi:hypothetical protein